MQLRSLGRTGLKVSRLGLGTMTWGRDTDEHEARDQLIAFAEAGGTLVDTAAGYTDGDSESLIGTLIGDVVARDEIVLATKAGISRRTGERVTDTSRGYLLSTLDASLKRLGVDHVDLWQVHIWSDETPIEETLSALDQAVSSGRASYVGVSNYAGWQTAQAATWQRAVPGRAPLASTQVEYSFLNRGDRGRGAACLRRTRARRAAVVAAGSRGADRQVPHRHAQPTPAAPPRSSPTSSAPTSTIARDGIVEAVAKAADGLGWTPLEVALVWVRDQPGVTAPIVGARTAAQLRGALGIEDKSLPPEICDALEDVSEAIVSRLGRRGLDPGGGVGVRQDDVLARVLPQRGHQAARRARRARRLGAGPGPDHPRRHPPRHPAPQDHPRGPHRLSRPETRAGRPGRSDRRPRNRSNTRAPNSRASTGTRSSIPWKRAVKSRSAGSRSGAKP